MNVFTFLMRKNPRPTITTALHSLPVKKAKVCRSGKNEKAGALLIINNLREASRLRHGGQERAANALVALSFPEKITEIKYFQRLCTDTGKAAANELFIGDGHRASGNILAFIRRPEMREALKHLSLSELVQPRTKRLQAIELMITSFIHFVSVCLATRGSRSSENQNALDAALASWVDEAIFDQRLGREVGRILDQNWKALRRGVTAHVQLASSKSWVRACKAEYLSQLGTASKIYPPSPHLFGYGQHDNCTSHNIVTASFLPPRFSLKNHHFYH